VQNRRKERRIALAVPVRVQGYTSAGDSWEEMTASTDTSHGGVSFPLKRSIALGQVVFLSLPLPKNFRKYELTDAHYETYGLVRFVRAATADNPVPQVGVMFLGRTAPRGYEKNPGGRYLLPGDPRPSTGPKERRKLKRQEAFVNLRLRWVDPQGRTLQEEQTVTENVSRGGVRVRTSLPVAKGERVEVEDFHGTFRAMAEIANLFIGRDGVPRLNLRFGAAGVPDQLLTATGLSPLDFV
jgi:hypothetical protein